MNICSAVGTCLPVWPARILLACACRFLRGTRAHLARLEVDIFSRVTREVPFTRRPSFILPITASRLSWLQLAQRERLEACTPCTRLLGFRFTDFFMGKSQ